MSDDVQMETIRESKVTIENNASIDGFKQSAYPVINRIARRGYSPFRFVPNSMLRLERLIPNSEEGSEEKKGKNTNMQEPFKTLPLTALVSAMNVGETLIGPFEIDVLTWINKLRYMTTSMIMDLYVSGYISPSWRKINKDKFASVAKRLDKYGLIDVTKFVSMNEDHFAVESKGAFRIYTLGANGNTLLNQMGREHHFNAFDIYQDGNIVKSYMAANQHLIYWLSAFPQEVKNNYETVQIIYEIGAEKNGARIYGTVKCTHGTIIIEPVRRTDRWGYEEQVTFLCEKLERFVKLFLNPDSLYSRSNAGQPEKFELKERPILCYTCEDEEHMKEVWQMIKAKALEYGEQEIWFTCDLKLYNDNEEGRRFWKFTKSDEVQLVNIHERLHLGKERDYRFLRTD